MSLPELAVRRPITTLTLLIGVLVMGAISITRLPLEFYPKLDIPFVMVIVPYPNSNPAQIEKTLARPLEEALATLPDIKKIRSRSGADQCEIQMEFDWGLELDVLRTLVREKVDQVRPTLPDDVTQILTFSFNTSDIPVVQARLSAEGVDLSENYALLESRIVNRLRRVPGVARVDLDGVLPREVYIEMRLDDVKAHSVDIGALIPRLRSGNTAISLGHISEDGMRFSARALGELRSVEDVGKLTVTDEGVRLSDIANIRYEEPPIGYGRHLNQQPAVAVNVFKESTANTVETVEAVQRVIDGEINSDPLLQGINFFVWEDQAREIRSGIEGLTTSGLIGGLFAVGVLYFFLRRFDATLIVSAAIPISLLATTAVMYLTGRNLNVLAMMGLMLGVGMLVDNAIVVLESIDRRHRDEGDTRRAAIQGASQVAMAITASTLTSVIVFLPLVIGADNDLTIFLGEAGFAIAVSLLASLLVSLLLIPLLSSTLLQKRESREPAIIHWLEERYVRILRWTFLHKLATTGLVLLGLIVGFLPPVLGLIETSTFAGGINRRLYLALEFHDFAYESDARRSVEKVEEFLFAHRDEFLVRDVYSFFQANRGDLTIVLSREDLGDREIKDLRKQIRDQLPELPEARIVFRDDDADEGGTTKAFQIKLFGNDIDTLNEWGQIVATRLGEIENVEDVIAPGHQARNEVQAHLDPARARKLGLDPQGMADVFGFTLGGIRLPRLSTGENEVEVNLGLAMEDRENLADLKQIVVGRGVDRPVQLGEVADFEIVPRAEQIERENRKVRIEVSAAFDGDNFDPTREEIAAMMGGLGLPGGVSWSWNDRIEEQDDQGTQMALNFLLALALVYILMASLFESVSQPFAILFAIPFSLVGAMWFLTLTGTPFNMMANMGVLILMGVVVNNGIVLLDRINYYRAEGVGREEAVFRSGRDRLRPIVMTASTTILGLVPLAIGGAGVGGWAYYYPLARTVMGGLASSTVLTLIVLPFINYGVESLSLWASRIWAQSAPQSAVEAGR